MSNATLNQEQFVEQNAGKSVWITANGDFVINVADYTQEDLDMGQVISVETYARRFDEFTIDSMGMVN